MLKLLHLIRVLLFRVYSFSVEVKGGAIAALVVPTSDLIIMGIICASTNIYSPNYVVQNLVQNADFLSFLQQSLFDLASSQFSAYSTSIVGRWAEPAPAAAAS